MIIDLPDFSLVLLIGPSGCGKSTFAAKHFLPTEVISSDECRGLVSDNENEQEATQDAFEVLRFILRKRMERRKLTVIDATNVQQESRADLIRIANDYHCMTFAIIFSIPEDVCQQRNSGRPERQFGQHVIRNQLTQLRRSIRGLGREGIRQKWFLNSETDVNGVELRRVPLWTDKRSDSGPFDIIGDVHGCYEELVELLTKLGYEISQQVAEHPDGRRLVFLGDLVDRGPNSPAVLRLVMATVRAGKAYCVPGNHDIKLVQKLGGRNVQIAHGLAETLKQLEDEPAEFVEEVAGFLDGLVSHYSLDRGNLVVAHAGMKAEYQNRASAMVREFALFGETTGETDEFGLPIRFNWAADYRGKARVVYGHTPVRDPEWLNRTINIDTGCVFGGRLSALRYPENETISVAAKTTYAEPGKPFLEVEPVQLTIQHRLDEVLDLEDVFGKRLIETRLRGKITIREEHASAALEAMSRFAANPKWLVYLPPTMSPCETSKEGEFLEHPAQAFDHYRSLGIEKVVCEEKHMGSRAVVALCLNEEAAKRKFGVSTGETGLIYTRTGRRFFTDTMLETALLARLGSAIEKSGLWQKLNTDWLVLDCELMPWSAKAQELLSKQYAPLGTASVAALKAALGSLSHVNDLAEASDLRERIDSRLDLAERYVEAYMRYCWPVNSIEDIRLAPFHILASEGSVHHDRDHLWHMENIAAFAREDSVFVQTPHKLVELANENAVSDAVDWWTQLTAKGGEGMVVKPLQFVATGAKGLVQPAVKCRGAEYLRIIYGPDYSLPENLNRLRRRGLSTKRSLALREFALGIEGLERFVRSEPLRQVHECVFAVLALESEPVDPRL